MLSAAHGWGGGDSTPLRLVAAVIPFLFLPIADALRAARTSRWRIAAFVMLAVLSVQNGLTYNRYFLKASQYFLMSGPSVSGWKMSLLLPATDGSSYALSPIFALWAAMTLALVAAPLWLPRAGRLTSIDAEGRGHLSGFVVASLVVVILLAVTGSTVGVLMGTTPDPHFLPDSSAVRDELLTPFLEGKPRLFFMAGSDRLRRTDMAAIFPSASDARVTVRPAAIEAIVEHRP